MTAFQDAATALHAHLWAEREFGLDHADAFVDWLLALDEDEQARVYERGYVDSGARDKFRAQVATEVHGYGHGV